jgi:mono/diheme cytochrome c family protein
MILERFLMLLALGFFFISCGSERGNSKSKNMTDKVQNQASKPAVHPGKILYMQFCLSCHMDNAEGVPGLYPPLTQTEFVLGDKERLIKIILLGQEGPIVVKGQPYNNIMTKLDFLGDKEISEVLTFIRSNFGNNADPVTIDEVKAVRNSLIQ